MHGCHCQNVTKNNDLVEKGNDMREEKYCSFQNILKFLSFDYEFEKQNRKYPFNRGKEEVTFSWGQSLFVTARENRTSYVDLICR